MATDEDLPQIEVETRAVADTEQTNKCDVEEEESHSSMKCAPHNSHGLRRPSPRAKLGKLTCMKVRSKFKNHRCCLWTSKAVVLVLIWNLIISIGFKSFFDPSLYTVAILKAYKNYYHHDYFSIISNYYPDLLIYGIPYGISALLYISLLSPGWILG